MILYYAYIEATTGKEMTSNIAKLLLGNPFSFPEAWHTVAFFSSIFVLLPSILVIMLVTNEYTFKTHRQNIIDGWSRKQFITSKLFDVLIVSVIATLVYVVVAASYGLYADSTSATGGQSNAIHSAFLIANFLAIVYRIPVRLFS
jgi:ABC-2 type transport system permease protein